MSFGYDAIRYEIDELGDDDDEEEGGEADTYPVRRLKEIRLWETSDVLWGANAATRASKFAALATPIDTLLFQLQEHITTLQAGGKEGRRNSAADQDRVNTIAKLAVELGADNVVFAEEVSEDGDEDEDKVAEQRRAEAQKALSLTLLEQRVRMFTHENAMIDLRS